jgi:hypothetical protein
MNYLLTQITTKGWVLKSQIRKVSHLRKVRKCDNYLTPQICGFAILFKELNCGPCTFGTCIPGTAPVIIENVSDCSVYGRGGCELPGLLPGQRYQ